MDKFKILLENDYDEVMTIMNDLYEKKYPRKSPRVTKNPYKVRVGDRVYCNKNFQDTYLEFLNDISKFFSEKTISNIMGKCCTFHLEDVTIKAKDLGCFFPINDRYHVNVKSLTDRKISHMQKMADYLGMTIEFEEL